MEGPVYEVSHIDKIAHIVKRKDWETLIVASVQTLKRNNKKCGKEEIFRLIQESVASEVTKEVLEELLDALAEGHYVKTKLLQTRTYRETLQNDLTNSNESSNESLGCNETLAINEIEKID